MSIAPNGLELRSGAWLCSSAEAVDIKARVLIVARVAAAARTLSERATSQILRATVAYGRRYPTKLGLRHAATKPFWAHCNCSHLPIHSSTSGRDASGKIDRVLAALRTLGVPASSRGWARSHACQHHRCGRRLINNSIEQPAALHCWPAQRREFK